MKNIKKLNLYLNYLDHKDAYSKEERDQIKKKLFEPKAKKKLS